MSTRAEKFAKCKHENVQDFTEICLQCGENIYSTVIEISRQELLEKEKDENKTFDKDNTGW